MKLSLPAPKPVPTPIPLTVALITYNRLTYLRQAVDSALRQSYRNFEFLILDNHSTDGTAEYLLGLDDPRLRYVRNAPESDAAFNSCSAFHLARGRRIVLFHDDDIMTEELLATQMDCMNRHPGLAMVWAQPAYIDAAGQALSSPPGTPALPIERIFAAGEYIQTFLTEGLWAFPSGVMYDAKIVGAQKSFQQSLAWNYFRTALPPSTLAQNSSCYDILWPTLLNTRHPIAFIPRPLLRYRLHDAQDTRSIDFSSPLIYLYRELKKIARRIPGHPIPAIRFDAYIARFTTQALLTMNAPPRLPLNKVKKLMASWQALQQEAAADAEAATILLPLTLAVSYYVDPHPLLQHQVTPSGNITQIAYRHFEAWAQKRARDAYLLAPYKQRRIVLFGSVFVAALLILDAQKTGAIIVACIDSNLNRQGRSLFGIPVYAPEWLADHAKSIDTIILTPEKAHEAVLSKIVRKWTDKALELISWKDLVPLHQTRHLES